MNARQYYATSPSNNKGAPPLTKSQIAHVVMVAGGSGRTPQRDKALLLCSITMGLRVTEIAHLEIRHIMGEDGKYLLEGWLPGTFSKSGKSAAIFPKNKKFQKALNEYFEWRIEKRHLLSGDPTKYRGLRPEGKVFLTETGRKFAMSKKRRTNDDGVKTEYDACDVLERAFKRLYRRAFGEETKFSSHSKCIPVNSYIEDVALDVRAKIPYRYSVFSSAQIF